MSSSSFKESYRVEPPKPRTHEQWLIDQAAYQAYNQMVDGKGDPPKPCDCDHDR